MLWKSFAWDQPSTYNGLAAACGLLDEISIRTSTSRSFKSLVRSSLTRSARLLAPIFLAAPDSTEITLNILEATSHLLTEPDTFTTSDLPGLVALVHRLSGQSLAALFDVSSLTIRKAVDELTIMAETRRREEREDSVPPGIPGSILQLLEEHSLNPPASDLDTANMLLSWLLISQFFHDTVSRLVCRGRATG